MDAAHALRRSEPRALVEIAHLSKGYVRGDQQMPVLTDINLTINERDFVALMGPSGSGKSTLLNLIAGIDKPTPASLRSRGDRHRATSRCASSPTGARRTSASSSSSTT